MAEVCLISSRRPRYIGSYGGGILEYDSLLEVTQFHERLKQRITEVIRKLLLNILFYKHLQNVQKLPFRFLLFSSYFTLLCNQS